MIDPHSIKGNGIYMYTPAAEQTPQEGASDSVGANSHEIARRSVPATQ